MEKQDFLDKANKKHNNFFIYEDLPDKVYTKSKIKIICPIHGEFCQNIANHIYTGYGCPKCGYKRAGNKQRSNTKKFIEKSKKIHGNIYDYSKVNYVDAHKKVLIICSIHGNFYQKANNHLNGAGCKKCADLERRTDEKLTKNFIKKIKKIYKDTLVYETLKYEGIFKLCSIECKKHGVFIKQAKLLSDGLGCPSCAKENKKNKISKDFFEISKKIHKNYYNYSESKYENSHKKIKIICPKHGVFEQTPAHHIQGKGCRQCCRFNSKGERKIADWLDSKNIHYIREKSFQDCINPITKMKLRFDFYLKKYNLLIEYDGAQHFKHFDFGYLDKSKEYLKKQMEKLQYRDQLKNKYCKDKNINLLRISYKKFNSINKILKKEIYG